MRRNVSFCTKLPLRPTGCSGSSGSASYCAGAIYYTYSTYHRGTELLVGALNWLDLAPKNRNEAGTMSWVRRLHADY